MQCVISYQLNQHLRQQAAEESHYEDVCAAWSRLSLEEATAVVMEDMTLSDLLRSGELQSVFYNATDLFARKNHKMIDMSKEDLAQIGLWFLEAIESTSYAEINARCAELKYPYPQLDFDE